MQGNKASTALKVCDRLKSGQINRFFMMKYYLLSFAITCFLASCGEKNTKEKLVIYSPHGKELLGEFEKLYEKTHPNVDVQWLDMGSQEVFDRVRTESQNAQADIWWGAPATIFMRAEKMGLLEAYKPTWADKVPVSARSKQDFWYGTFATPQVIAFNSNKLQAENAPKDWAEIVSPAWKGKVVMRNPLASGTLRSIFSAMLALSVTETGNEERGWQWLRQLNENTSVYAADPTQMYAKLGGENEAVTLWNMPDIVLQTNKNKYPFGYVFPEKGTIILTDAMAIVKGTKHLALAKDFYEFVNTEENLLLQAEKYYRIPARTDIPAEKLPTWLKAAKYSELAVDWNMVAEKEAEWMKKWDAEIKNKQK